ncbi:Imm1 family immunity protein [Amycolatopsis sp. cg5]|uniref:Imm1 family immunity protein n=1 Tax=Amycolatopsis sp. cg5 TaxID=3238802 RepID=UPI0035257EE2
MTASLTNEVACVARSMRESLELIDDTLKLEHLDWESVLYVGDTEYYQTKSGPVPNHQMRVSVRPSSGYGALNYMDHSDSGTPIMNSYNPKRPLPSIDLVFNGSTGAVFPQTAILPIADIRRALVEWIETRSRPTCIKWLPYDMH